MRFSEIISEAGSPAQQAAIAIAMKKAGKKPKGVAEGAPELLKKEMPLHRHVEKLLAQNGVSKDDPDYHHHLNNTIKHLRQFGNIDLINKSDEQGVAEGENWSKHNHKRVGGMSDKSVASYRRSHPGSKIQTAVTTKPSKLKKGSKSAKRRASFCARMRGMKKHRTGAKTAHDPNSNINKSLRRWHCESIEELHELVMIAEQFIRNNKK